MRKLLFAVFCSFVLLSCGDTKPQMELKFPLVPVDTMVVLVYELQLIESVHAVRSYSDSLATPLMLHRVHTLFEQHGVSKEQFEESLRYYQESGDELDEIYSGAVERASEAIAKAESE